MFPIIFTIYIAPMYVYYHNNDVLMFVWSISTPFALIISWLLCSTETNNHVYFLYRVGDVIWPFLLLQSAQPSSIIKLESRERVGGLWRWYIAPLHCTVALMYKNVENMLTPSIRRSGRQNRAIERLPRHCRFPMDIYCWNVRRGGVVNGGNDDYPRH